MRRKTKEMNIRLTWHSGGSRCSRWPQHSGDNGSELVVLASETSDLLEASVEALVGWIHSPRHLHMFAFFLLHNVAKQGL